MQPESRLCHTLTCLSTAVCHLPASAGVFPRSWLVFPPTDMLNTFHSLSTRHPSYSEVPTVSYFPITIVSNTALGFVTTAALATWREVGSTSSSVLGDCSWHGCGAADGTLHTSGPFAGRFLLTGLCCNGGYRALPVAFLPPVLWLRSGRAFVHLV